MDNTTLRVGLLLELKEGSAVITQSVLIAALSSECDRVRILAEAVAQKRGIQLV